MFWWTFSCIDDIRHTCTTNVFLFVTLHIALNFYDFICYFWNKKIIKTYSLCMFNELNEAFSKSILKLQNIKCSLGYKR